MLGVLVKNEESPVVEYCDEAKLVSCADQIFCIFNDGLSIHFVIYPDMFAISKCALVYFFFWFCWFRFHISGNYL